MKTPPELPNIVVTESPYQRRRKSSSGLLVGAIIAIVLGAGILLAMVMMGNSLNAIGKTAQEKAVLNWIDQNEGDPGSVEIIEIDGPRLVFDREWMRAKYRATGPMGGPVVNTVALKINDDGSAEEALTHHILLGWNNFPRVGESEADHQARVVDPLGDWIKETTGRKKQ